jgi:hypothetical protein
MICPCCKGTGDIPDLEEAVARQIETLKAHCRAQGYSWTFDDLVKQSAAAELLDNRSERTLERWRYEGGPIQPARKNLWALADIARFQIGAE